MSLSDLIAEVHLLPYEEKVELRHHLDRDIIEPEELDVLTVFGEPFIITDADGQKMLKHPNWSLMGIGDTLAEAYAAMLQEAEDVSEYYLAKDDAELTSGIVEFKQFLSKVVN